MDKLMLLRRKNYQILYAIICLITVQMMNFLLPPQAPTQMFFHNKAMFTPPFSGFRNINRYIASALI